MIHVATERRDGLLCAEHILRDVSDSAHLSLDQHKNSIRQPTNAATTSYCEQKQ